MDSGNSGSMQSSSGGDDEYDSRAESISAFLTSGSGHVGALSTTTTTTHQQPPPHHPHLQHHHHHHQHNSSSFLFDSLSNYLTDPFSRPTPPNPSSLLNLDMVLPGSSLRSDQQSNCTNFNSLMAPSSSVPIISSSSQPPISGLPPHSGRVTLPTDQQQQPQPPPNQQQQQPPGRNPKKRSRASRRAPTTVLTTDTSNFRAMVQEFTGIPAPPFSASAFPAARTRLDLFNSSTSSTMSRSGSLLLDPSPPSYLLRPFAQKLNPPPFLSSFSSSSSPTTTPIIDHVIASSSTATTSTNPNSTSTSTSNNYQLLSDHHQLGRLNMQNPSLIPYHSLLQSSSIPTVDSRLKMGVLEEFSMNTHDHNAVRSTLHLGGRGGGGGGGLPNLITSDHHQNPSSNLGIGSGSNDDGATGDQDLLRSFNGNYSNSQQNNGCKQMKYYSGSSTSDFNINAEKGSIENNNTNVSNSSRGDGMVDSWICSSD